MGLKSFLVGLVFGVPLGVYIAQNYNVPNVADSLRDMQVRFHEIEKTYRKSPEERRRLAAQAAQEDKDKP